MNQIMISFIIAVYNMEKFVSCCLNSILSQAVKEYEVICVNNDSKDSSAEIIRGYVEKYDNFKMIELSHNMGAAYARNEGLKYAKGEYIFFLDPDDWIREDALDILLRVAKANDPDIICFNYLNHYPPNPDRWRVISLDNYDKKIYSGQELFTELVNDGQFNIALCTRLYKKIFLEKNGIRFIVGINTEDTIFVFMCMMKAKTVSVIDEKIYYYRRRANSVSLSITRLRTNSMFYSILEILYYWKSNKFTDDVNKAIESYLQERYGTFLWLKDRTGISQSVPLGHEADRFFFKMYSDNAAERKEYLHINQEDYEVFRKAKRCFIYGAGKYGKELFDKLFDENINVEAFLVTDSTENNMKFCREIPVIGIDEWDFPEDALVIIAVSANYRNEMIQMLTKKNYRNFYVVM